MRSIARRLWRLLSDPATRRHVLRQAHSSWLLSVLRPPGRLQPFDDTAMDRYPDLFAAAARLLPADRPLSVLSFGCSTGEEALTLRRYFPQADIVGVDVNPWNVAVCRWRRFRAADQRMRFLCAGSADRLPAGSYDAVFCLAVLRDGRVASDAASCRPFLRFEDVDRLFSDLARRVLPGGLLAIAHSHFRVADMTAFDQFSQVPLNPHATSSVDGLLFDRADRRLPAGAAGGALLCRDGANG